MMMTMITMIIIIIIIIIIILLVCGGKTPTGQKLFMHFHLMSMLRMDGVTPLVSVSHVTSWHAQGKVSQCLRMVILIVKMK